MSIHVHTRLVCNDCGTIAGTFEDTGVVPGRSRELRRDAYFDGGWRRTIRTMPDGETFYYVDLCPRCQRGMALVNADR